MKSHPAHNCLVIRKADGSPDGTTRIRGDLRKHFIVAPHCQVVDTAEYDPADWAAFGNDETGEMSRQVLLMVPSEEHQYVIDIARGRGGHTHDYYFHCHGLDFESEGIELAEVADAEQNLYDYSGWAFKAAKYRGARNVRKLFAGRAAGPWQATWSRIDDYRGQPAGEPKIHDGVSLRLWMIDQPGSEVIVGTAPAQRHFKNEDIGRTMKVACVRRPNTDDIDSFVAVMEPYKDNSFIKSVRRLTPEGVVQYTVALAVETIHGTDYVLAHGGPDQPPTVRLSDRGHTIQTDADVAVVSFPNSRQANLLLAGGSFLKADGIELTADGRTQFTGRLVDFDDARDTLTIESQDHFPIGDALAGRVIVVQHREDRSTFTIDRVESMGADRFLVHLADQPHLMNNWLLVHKVDRDGIWIEPRPVLDSKRRTYKVYGGEPGALRLLGPLKKVDATMIRNEIGPPMHTFHRVITDDCSGVEPGQEIGIARLEKGRDTVCVTNYAYVVGGVVK